MKHLAVSIVSGLIAIVIVSGVIYLEVSTWNECRETNSFWYCLRVLK